MTIPVFPASPLPSYPFKPKRSHKTIIDDYDGGAEQASILWLFPKLIIPPLTYEALVLSDRNILYDFWRGRYGQALPFWFVDFDSRHWLNEYVGRGGPLNVLAAYQLINATGIYTDFTRQANDDTAGDVLIHPAAGANDEFIIVSDVMFDKITFTIATPGAGTYTISSWKYSKNDGTWATISVTDGTTNFKAAAGDHDVTFTIPTDWDTKLVSAQDGYALKCIFDGGTVTTPPTVTRVKVNSKTYDLHCKSAVSNLLVYVNGVLKTGGGTDYTLVTGGGAAGADRITFNSYLTQGDLAASSFDGLLRIKARYQDDDFNEEEKPIEAPWTVTLGLREIQW